MPGPFNFQATDTNAYRLLGGNISALPTEFGGAGTTPGVAWPLLFGGWSNYFPNWIKPQVRLLADAGVNNIRMIGGLQGVMSGDYTQAYYNTCLLELIAECRARGVWFSTCGSGFQGYGSAAGFTVAKWEAALISLHDNVYAPNVDVIPYVEAGNQESDLYGGHAQSAAFCHFLQARAASTGSGLKVGISHSNEVASAISASNADILMWHLFPQFAGGGIDQASLSARFANIAAMNGSASGRRTFVEETGYRTDDYSQKVSYIAATTGAFLPPPMSAGCQYWLGFPTLDGNWSWWDRPPGSSLPGPDYIWADTPASIRFKQATAANEALLTTTPTPTPVPTPTPTPTAAGQVLATSSGQPMLLGGKLLLVS